jgi:hypothetical protein
MATSGFARAARHAARETGELTPMIERIARELRHGALAAAIFVALVAPHTLDAQGAGSITGIVTANAAVLPSIRVTIDQRVCGNELPDEAVRLDGGRLANAVVTLVGVKARTHAATAAVVNEKCRFTPRVQIVRPQATITTTSSDPILHTTNAQQADGRRTVFNIAVPIPGIKIAKPVAGPGLLRLTCNTHPWMRGWIVVTEDMAAVTAADGSFTLSAVPAGTYELRVWHESLKGAAQKVTVSPGKPTNVSLTMQ